MIPKEMAADLYNKFYETSAHQNSVKVRQDVAKNQAKICVDEILRACNEVYDSDMVHFKETGMGSWWQSVKNEINNIGQEGKLEMCGFCRGKKSVRVGASIHETCRHCEGRGYNVVV